MLFDFFQKNSKILFQPSYKNKAIGAARIS